MRNLTRWVIAMAGAAVLVAPAVRAAPQRLRPAELMCRASQPEALAGASGLAGAARPRRDGGSTDLALATRMPAPPLQKPEQRFRLNGQKYASPTGARTEAGVGLSLGSQVSIQLNYERTASVPLMGYANDNGILARLRIAF